MLHLSNVAIIKKLLIINPPIAFFYPNVKRTKYKISEIRDGGWRK